MLTMAFALLLFAGVGQEVFAQDMRDATKAADVSGPVRLRQSDAASERMPVPAASAVESRPAMRNESDVDRAAAPSEVESFVSSIGGRDLDGEPVRRFGSELMTGPQAAEGHLPQVPSDYVIGSGDEIHVGMTGSIDADLDLVVDRSGRLNIPRVGAVLVAGVRYADLPAVLSQRVAQVFRGFQLTASLGQLRGIRIYVTGFTAHPGSYTVSSLSTIVNALMKAGGPSDGGSFRNIQLLRNGKSVTRFDLYDLLMRGDKSADRVLEPEDVLYIGAVGPQVGVLGSVNRRAIFELKDGDTVADVVQMAGGFTSVGDASRLAIERLDLRNDVRIVQLSLPADDGQELKAGDVIRAFSLVASVQPIERQNKRVKVEGEVLRPGEIVLPAGSTISDAMRAAGGLTSQAYVFGTDFRRESVRVTQQENYDRALRDMETDLQVGSATRHASTSDDASVQLAQSEAATRMINALRSIRPNGRIVLEIALDARTLPDMPVEDGDRLYVPPRPTTVGVFGSVFNGGSYLFRPGRSIGSYLGAAGGPKRGADKTSIFIVHANGSITSALQHPGGWFGQHSDYISDLDAIPGDTVFVPEEIDKSSFLQNAKDWTQILYQFGLGAAAIAVLNR